MSARFLSTAAVLAICGQALGQPDIYVDADATGANDGSSWADAYTDLQDALDDAASTLGDIEIWVAEGTYIRSGGAPTDGFLVTKTVGGTTSTKLEMYGGFDGTETNLSDRAGLFSTTIISGDRGVTGVTTDNSTNVVRVPALVDPGPPASSAPGPRLRLDGFVVRDGSSTLSGSAILVSNATAGNSTVTIVNSVIRDNIGSAVASEGGGIHNSSFIDDTSANSGGALASSGNGAWSITNSNFIGNHSDQSGGAISFRKSFGEIEVFGCVFAGNSADANGGAINANTAANVISGGVPGRYEFRVSNSTFYDNTAVTAGGGIHFEIFSGAFDDLSFIANSIFWQNSAATGASIGGVGADLFQYNTDDSGLSGTGNINADPLFFNAATDDFRLRPASPARNAGLSDAWSMDAYDFDFDTDLTELVFEDNGDVDGDGVTLEAVPLDNDGARNREIEGTIDMGAFESCPSDSNLDGMSTPADFSAWTLAFNNGDLTIADVNRDGVLTGADANAWTAAYNAGCN